jgi:HD superfamily phosphohydrolase
LRYARRFRDLVHGFVYLTPAECEVVDHQLFQRLRHIRQNDVASFVYPSLNVTRFEHSLGCCHVAGRISANLRLSEDWPSYEDAVRAGLDLGGDDFEQVCRLYALLHDIGHLPFSHLFETALEDHAARVFATEPGERRLKKLCEDWFGPSDFKKPHEAFGRMAAAKILKDATSIPAAVRRRVQELMDAKKFPRDHLLQPVKQLIDSEVDADRIDSTARDGKLAGGEYGSYDIERLCSGVRLVKNPWGEVVGSPAWELGYSRKALSSLEGLLLDRYRTHTWIHFHHRVVATKCAMRVLIARLLAERPNEIKSTLVRDGAPSESAGQFDDVWLWSELRARQTSWTSEPEASALPAVLRRQTDRVHLLWKDRIEWTDAWKAVQEAAGARLGNAVRDGLGLDRLGRVYEGEMDAAFRRETAWTHLGLRIHLLPFKPLDDRKLPIVGGATTSRSCDLRDQSPLAGALDKAWDAEPQLYAVVFGDLGRDIEGRTRQIQAIRGWWACYTAAWLSS